MKEEKNIDRLFQEKFKNFERHPSDAVWKNIVAAREEKEDRKLIPIWWKIGGAAAVIALLFTIGLTAFNNTSNDSLDSDIVVTPAANESTTEQSSLAQEVLVTEVAKQSEESPATTNNIVEKTASLPSSKEQKTYTPKIAQNNSTQNSAEQKDNTTGINSSFTSVQNKATSSQDAITNGIALSDQNNKEKSKSSTSPLIDQEVIQKDLNDKKVNATGVAQNTQEPTIKDEENEEEKISLIEEAKRIEEDKKENEAVALVEDTPIINRWDVGAVAAPVFYGDFGGSGIDPSFSDNAKSGDVNFSYGVQVSYSISPKLKVRSGVSNVDLSYNTSGIAFNASADARRLSGINYNQNARVLNIVDATPRQGVAVSQDELFSENSEATRIVNGSLQQRVGFVEIPVEAVYVFSDKRIGVQLVGGLSTLFLNNNEVILNSEDGLQNNLGSANGVNDVSFTTNIGLGLDYKMTDKIKFNMEPSLKYQLNAFDQSVGDFKPYFIGLYTGVSYRF